MIFLHEVVGEGSTINSPDVRSLPQIPERETGFYLSLYLKIKWWGVYIMVYPRNS
jgi:hypothetical protein